jgi:IS30 family transposase
VTSGVRVPREVRRGFWLAVRSGVDPCAAAVVVGVSGHAGRRWFADAGGVIRVAPALSGVRLSLAERETIGLMRASGSGVREVARALGRDPSTISRELARNATPSSGVYRPLQAQLRAEARARRPKPVKLAAVGPLRDFVAAHLRLCWSPTQISRRLRCDFADDEAMQVCPETIYQALYVQSRGALKRDLTAHLRRRQTVRKPHGRATASTRGRLSETISISERPAEAADRAVPGHWEGDLIVGKDNGSAIGTLVERSTRFVMLIHLPRRRTAEEFRDALVPTIAALPDQLRRSLTWDNGKEMALHKTIAADAAIAIYFADPGKPWQRGSNENTNGLLRQYFPKGISLRQFSPDDLTRVAAELNSRPRKTLDWKTPGEAMNQLLSQPFEPVLR